MELVTGLGVKKLQFQLVAGEYRKRTGASLVKNLSKYLTIMPGRTAAEFLTN
jgi:hypothetical protein